MQAGRGRIMQKSHSQAADKPAQLAKQAAKKPSNQADRHMQAARPTTNKRDTRSEQAMQHTHSEPASKTAKQPGHQPASQRSNQPASQTQANNKQKQRQTGRQTQQYSQQSMDSAGSTACLQPIASTKEFHFERPLGSKCKRCFKERKQELKQWNPVKKSNGSQFLLKLRKKHAISKARASLISTFFYDI